MFKKIDRTARKIISSIIPSIKLRRIIRNNKILRSFECIKMLACEKLGKQTFQDEISIVTVVKNEAEYIQEWIEYHKLVGVTRFYIFDNESTDNLRDVLDSYIREGTVVYEIATADEMKKIFMDGFRFRGIEKAQLKTKWLSIIDVDEFILPKNADTISGFLETMPKKAKQVILEWQCFGSNGHVKKPRGLVIENYTARGKDGARFAHKYNFKSIFNPRAVAVCFNHYQTLVPGALTFDSSGNQIDIERGIRNLYPAENIAVNHYIVKSKSECLAKCQKNDAIHRGRYDDSYFRNNDFNDVQDRQIVKYAPEIKKVL